LNAKNGSAKQRVFTEHIVPTAQNSPFGRFEHETGTDKFLNFRRDVE